MASSATLVLCLCLALALAASPCLAGGSGKQSYNWDDAPYVRAYLNKSRWHVGSATYYGSNPLSSGSGNCGFPRYYLEQVHEVAVPMPRWSDSKTPGVPDFPGAACGQCFELLCYPKPRYAGKVLCKTYKRIKVTITNYDVTRQAAGFPGPYGWPHNHFDLRQDGFAAVADPTAGIVNVFFRRVPCDANLQPKYTVQGNPFWHDITVFNVPGAGNIVAVQVQCSGSSSWVSADHAWGGHYWLNAKCDFTNSATKVKAQVAESSNTWVYPMQVSIYS